LKVLFILDDAPYGSEKAYLALRLAMIMQRDQPEVEIRIFLMADSVGCALPNQDTPKGYYNLERMIKSILKKGGIVNVCSSCMKARGFTKLQLVEGVEVNQFAYLSNLIVDSDKIVTL
jgi:uncharacterized protein involved in oxidation of intracellular sulfur